jgi:hypothetical protein
VSTGHLQGEEKPEHELYKILGEGDTPKLYARAYTLDTTRDIPYGGGVSVDGKVIFIDEWLYKQIMAGKVMVKRMTPRQIIQAIVEHEHTEWSVDVGDNPVDTYQAAHGFAIAKEHKFVRQLGVSPQVYENALEPFLHRCLARDPIRVPQNLWCGPYLDEPTARDRQIIRIFRSKGVEDAFKSSKLDAQYGMGEEECQECSHYNHGKVADFGPCAKVCGLVRCDRHCKWFAEKRAA